MNNHISGTFEDFFKEATGGLSPYPYQQKLSSLEEIPDILNIPTGAGKTEASVLAIYLWRILNSDENVRQSTPRRLVYCLPMRVLVEQTVKRIKRWLCNLRLDGHIKVIPMMGGNADKDYIEHPEDNMILVGTQDMLLSRALNRGYVSSPYQWPRDFGMLNNDCLWVMDEIQLMQNGLATSTQLQAFREKFGTYGTHKTVWMSATVNPQWLDTVDFDSKKCTQFRLSDEDARDQSLKKRNSAKKELVRMGITIAKNNYEKKDIESIKEKHVDGTITLVIVNTVKRAQSIFKELEKTMSGKCILVHSRFRKQERQKLNEQLERLAESSDEDMIVVSTQVIEAGIDISVKTLITEIAPWPSMIQRFGRCNRKGIYDDSKIYVIELDEKAFNPYEKTDMIISCDKVGQRYGRSMSPEALGPQTESMVHEAVIRETDILSLFDTSSDLSGNYTDVSMYVRSIEMSADVAVAWRYWDVKKEELRKNRITDDEICMVPVYEAKEFMKKSKVRSYVYDRQFGDWKKSDDVRPGQTILIHCDLGGYDAKIGWDPAYRGSVSEIDIHNMSEKEPYVDEHAKIAQDKEASGNTTEENNSDDSQSSIGRWITLNDHTVHVMKETEDIINNIGYLEVLRGTMMQVAKFHDVGKAHHVFQNTMLKDTDHIEVTRDEFWAKRGRGIQKHERDNYRHEALSALVVLEIKKYIPNLELVAYLIASHHGKVRMSMRTMLTKKRIEMRDTEYLLGIGIEYGEKVPVFLSDKHSHSELSKEKIIKDNNLEKEVNITVDIARIGSTSDGRQSWLQMTLNLLKEHGPFKLAFLETVIRAVDTRASRKESQINE